MHSDAVDTVTTINYRAGRYELNTWALKYPLVGASRRGGGLAGAPQKHYLLCFAPRDTPHSDH